MSFHIGSLETASSGVNSQIEHPEIVQIEPSDVSGQRLGQRVSSLFNSTLSNGLSQEGVILGVNGDWIKFDPNNPLRSKAQLTFENGMQFQGSLWNGQPQGMNRINFLDGSWLQGYFVFKRGFLSQAPITMGYPNGDVFKGKVISFRDEMEGDGIMTFANGDWIRGTFKGKVSVGKATGVMTLVDGSKFEGLFLDGRPCGKGTVIGPNKDRLTGYFDETGLVSNEPAEIRYFNRDWIRGMFGPGMFIREGKGKLTLENGAKFKGHFLDGKPHDRGIMICADKSTIEGEFDETGLVLTKPVEKRYCNGDWIRGTFDGQMFVGEAKGRVILADGSEFRGSFFNEKPYGEGMVTYKNKCWIKGQFDETGLMLTKPVEISYFNGDCFEGFIFSLDRYLDTIENHGTLTFANKDWIQGLFNKRRHIGDGTGLLTVAQGVKFSGNLRNGRPYGQGILSFDDILSNKKGIRSIAGQFYHQMDPNLSEPVQITYSDGQEFEGTISPDGVQGKGIIRFPNGDWIQGDFMGRSPVGQGWGRLTDERGKLFEGEFWDGKPNSVEDLMNLDELLF